MTVLSLGTTAAKIIGFNKRRKVLSITNDHVSAKVYLDDTPDPTSTSAKWIILPKETLIWDGQGDFPERAVYGISDTASTTIVVGFQNAEK